LAGSGFIALFAWLTLAASPVWVLVCGFTGMLADSAAGSLFQARYRADNHLADAQSEEGNFTLVKGLFWLDNDLVNLLSNLLVTILAGFLLYFCA
jgi:uncharacterized membrane protein